MPSSFTTRNRLTKQAAGENLNTWGLLLNTGVFDLVDFLADGITTISASGATTLSTANGAVDQARARVINYTGAAAGTITIAAVEKLYLVRAVSADATITAGGAAAVVKAGDIAWVVCDGAAVRKAQSNDFGGARVSGVGAPAGASDAATKGYVDSTAFAMAAGSLPGQAGNAGKFLTTNGAAASWGEVDLAAVRAQAIAFALVL